METWAFTARLLRTTLRSRTAAAAAVLFALGLVGAGWLGVREAHGASVLLLSALLLLTLVVSGVAVGAGAALPEDRVAGREEWLATLAPPAWKRRLAVVLAAWLLAVGCGLAGGLVIGVLASWLCPDLALRSYASLELPARTITVPQANGAAGSSQAPLRALLADDADRGQITLVLPPFDPDLPTVEVDVRPRFSHKTHTTAVDRLRVLWATEEAAGAREISARGPARFELTPGARRLHLLSGTPGVRLRIVGARRLGSERPIIPAAGLAGLLLGLLAAAVAPVAVFVSRSTTGQTAAAAAFSLLLFGVAKGGLLQLAADLHPEGLMSAAPPVLRTIAWVAPNAAVFHVFEQIEAGRVPAVGFAALPWAALLYTVIATVIACAPAPRVFRAGANT